MNSFKFSNALSQEFNLAALRARGCLYVIYKINEKLDNEDSQLELLNEMKNSDKITKEIYNSINVNKSSGPKLKKIKITKLNKLDLHIVKFVRNKDTNLFINEERFRMNKAIESLKKLNNNFCSTNNNKSNLLHSVDLNRVKGN